MDRPRTSWEWPEIGVYLSERWIEDVPLASFHWAGPTLGPAAQVVVLPCPDGGLPLHANEAQRVLEYALDGARAGRFVEVGCHAGHGRTGLALASLMILAGDDPDAAMHRVWKEYCDQAIETRAQERYLLGLGVRTRRDKYNMRRTDDHS
jgi:protein-tyrosine phosphatase